MFPWSCKARLQPQRLKWIQLYKEKIPIDDINCKANIVEFWFFTSRVTVVPIPAMVFKKLRFWHEKFTPCLDRTKDHFYLPLRKKKSPYFWEGFSTTVALKYNFGQIEWIMCPSTLKKKKLCASAGFSRRFTIFEGSFISIIIALDRNLQLARVSGHF